MRSTRIPLRAVSLLVGGMAVVASTIPPSQLFERHELAQCADANWDRCPQITANHWPDNFCCKKGSTCLSTAGNTTLICCPAGSNCTEITPTLCEMDSYNADVNPAADIKTTALNGVLGRCGDACCAFGYHCYTKANGQLGCQLDKNQNAVPITTTPVNPSTTASGSDGSLTSAVTTTSQTTQSSTRIAPSPTSSPTTTSTPGQNNGASSGADTSPTSTPPQTTPAGPPTAVIAGAVVGAAILVAAVVFVAFIFYRRRHRRQAAEAEERALKLHPRSTSSFGNIISNPIASGDAAMRTDFVRKSPGRASVASGYSEGASTLLDDDDAAAPPPVTPTPVRMREGVGTSGRIPPIRNMAQARQARQSSIAYGVGGPDTSPYSSSGGHHAAADDGHRGGGGSMPYPVTPRQMGSRNASVEREPSSISINVFADPRIATPQRAEVVNMSEVPETPDNRRHSHMTTFSDMMRSADLGDVARGQPYVPDSQNGTPSSRRR